MFMHADWPISLGICFTCGFSVIMLRIGWEVRFATSFLSQAAWSPHWPTSSPTLFPGTHRGSQRSNCCCPGSLLCAFPQAKVLTLIPLGFFLRMTVLPAGLVLGAWFVLQFFQGVMSLGGPDVGGWHSGLTLAVLWSVFLLSQVFTKTESVLLPATTGRTVRKSISLPGLENLMPTGL